MLTQITKLKKNLCLPQFKFLIYSTFYYLYTLIFTQKTDEDLWIIGECHGECQKDNSYWFFRYCRDNHPQHRIFFVLNRYTVNFDYFLQNDKNILYYGSLKHAKHFILANVCIYSVSYRDIAYKLVFELFKRNIIKVFLDHGIIGFKRMNWLYNAKRNKMDMFCVTSSMEKEIVDKNFNFNPRITKITGLARYDELSTKTTTSEKSSIIYMPTWRDWIISDFSETFQFKVIASLLSNKKLSLLLKEHGLTFIFYPHRKIRKKFDHIHTNNNIKIAHPNNDTIQNAIVKNALMITDYSSVAWDFYYLKKPVVFYQFDQEEYLEKTGSYLDFNQDLFGELHKKEDTLVDCLERYIVNNFHESNKYGKMREHYFNFFDNNNCQRIFQTINSLSLVT